MDTILRARKQQVLRLTRTQHDILIGCILGDAYITKRGQIQIEQGSVQESYVRWKYQQLQSAAYGPPKVVIRVDRRCGGVTTAYRFWTRQFFRPWRTEFYQNNKKIMPRTLTNLSPLSLAVWYMDDGCLVEGRRVVLATDGFDGESRNRICAVFASCFGVRPTIKASGKLLFSTRYTRQLMVSIQPYVVPSMAYKLLDPVTTDLRQYAGVR